MIKVLHLYSDSQWDGPAELAFNLCSALRPEWDVLFIHDKDRNSPSSILSRAMELGGVPIDTPFPLPKHYHFAKMLFSAVRFYSYIKDRGIRIVHAHRLADHLVAAGASYRARIPIVWSLYSEDPPTKVREKILLHRFADSIVVPSERSREVLLERMPGVVGKTWVVPPGVDTDRFNPQRASRESARNRLGIRPEEYVVGLVSRIRPTRKVHIAVEAWTIASRKSANLRLLILGGGKRRNVQKTLLKPIKRFRIGDKVLRLGNLDDEGYVEALAAMDVGIFLAPGSDKSCRTVREYMAMGLPVIGCSKTILSDLVRHGDNGLLVECYAQQIAKAIIDLAKNQSLSEKMGKESLERIHKRFSLKLQADAISEVYRTLLSQQ